MFKRGPDGKMREAHFFGGLAGLPTMWRGAKFFAPKFSNLGYNFNKGMKAIGVPKVTRDGLKFGTKPREVKPVNYEGLTVGSTGPRNYSILDEAYDARTLDWKKKLDTLMQKHDVRGLTFKMMPQEIKDHYKLLPRMSKGRKRVEQIGYGLGVPALYGWGPGYPDDPEANVEDSLQSDAPEDGAQGAGVDESETSYAKEAPVDMPKETLDEMNRDPDNTQGFDYDGQVEEGSNRQPGLFGSQGAKEMADIKDDMVLADDEISMEGINKYKQELKSIIGEEDKTTGSLMLMQLGLGMMAGKSNQPGFAGFAEILGKTGQEVLPMFMQHLQNKRKEDKEISLAAYDMLREDRAAKRERESDLSDWVWKEDYKNYNNPPGTLSNIMIKRSVPIPGGGTDDTWEILKQTHSKSPEALTIIESGNPNMRVVPLNISDAGMLAGGLGDPKGKWTDSQRGENAQLAVTLEKNIGQVLDFLMDPQQGLHSGNFKTGYTGKVIKGLRFITKESQQALEALGVDSPIMGDMATSMYGLLGESTALSMGDLVDSGGLMPGAGNQKSGQGQKKISEENDIWHGTAMGANGQMVEGDYATETYVRSLTDNSLYDIETQLTNMMGFLEARLKQPTGRLLADTIKSSIAEQAPLGGMKDPVQASNQMHFFVKRLYEGYARHAGIGGVPIRTEWEGRMGTYSIQEYDQSWKTFTGNQAAGAPIDFSFLPQQQNVNVNGAGNIYNGQTNVKINGPQDLGGLLEKWSGSQ